MWRIGFLVWRVWIYLTLTAPAVIGLRDLARRESRGVGRRP